MKFKRGNKKLGKDTLIFNMTSATNCPSKRLGLCQLKGRCESKCYALRAEKRFPAVLEYREEQAGDWTFLPAWHIMNRLHWKLKREHIKNQVSTIQ